MEVNYKDKNYKLVSLIDESDLAPQLKSHKLSDSEYSTIKNIMNRAPTFAELGVFSAMWSEHCSYKSSRVHLGRFPTEGENVVVGPGENAGVVHIDGDLCLAFKMESHNHPSYIEPYQGAATGVGGILRDVFCMGSRPIANLNCLRFGEKSHPRTEYLYNYVVKGIGDYGNCIGIPTVGGNVSFDKTYNGNCLVNAMTVGVIDKNKIFKGFASGQGNLVVYVGSATGRDGIHGATMASDSFDTERKEERGTIQVGDPFTEKLLLEATLAVLEKGLVVGIQDMGAAGLTSSSVEMAGRAGNGLLIDLSAVPIRTTQMTAYELLLSESQERMLMVVEPKNWDALKEELDRWELHSAIIGEVTDTGHFQCVHKGNLEVDIPVMPLTDSAPKYERPVAAKEIDVSKRQSEDSTILEKLKAWDKTEAVLAMLADIGDKSPIFHQYDYHIGTKTVFGPEDGGAAVMWLRTSIPHSNKNVGVAIATGCNERFCKNDPLKGGAYSVLHAANEIVARGGVPLGTTDCLNFGNPEDPKVMWQFSQSVDGISEACRELNAPIVSGNVSLYNETNGESIHPTPMIGMVGRIDDVNKAPQASIYQEGTLWLMRPKSQPAFGASLAAKIAGFSAEAGTMPEISWQQVKETHAKILGAAKSDTCRAIRAIGQGGVFMTLAKMLEPNSLGGQFKLDNEANWWNEWLGEYTCAFLMLTPSGVDLVGAVGTLEYSELKKLGEVIKSNSLSCDGFATSVSQLKSALKSAYNFS